MKISLILAASKNGVIGNKGLIPWSLKTDLKHFKDTTNGSVILMGRKTYETIKEPLPNRHNIVVSSGNSKFIDLDGQEIPFQEQLKTLKNLTHVKSVQEGIEFAKNTLKTDLLYIVGGSGIYEESLKYAQEAIITHVHAQVEGDAIFDFFSDDHKELDNWIKTSSVKYFKDQDNEYDFDINVYVHKTNK
eukprot:gene4547-5665_t